MALLYRSPSGTGLKGAVRIPTLPAVDPVAYAIAWHAVTLWLASLSLDNDPAVKDVSRLAFLAHDPGAHLNLQAAPFDVARWTPAAPVDPQPLEPQDGLRPGDDFNRRADLAALLIHHGWTLVRDGDNQHWSRPGKNGGTSATLKDGIFYVFSSNAAPFEANCAYRPFAVLALLEHGGDFAAAARTLRQHGFGSQAAGPSAVTIVDDPPEAETPDPGILPADLLRVPGFISHVMDFTLATAPYPEPTLAFCGALTLLATLAGRKVCDPGNVRTNLYCLALANSGTGKDHPRKVNERVLLESGLIGAVGDNFASGEGIEDAMVVQPTLLFQTDEIDGMLLAIAKSRDGRAERIMEMLLKFYSAANQHYHCRVKAGTERQSIDQPCLVLFGTAVPKHYYEALCEKMLSNGFFARMLVFEAGPRGQGQEVSIMSLPDVILRTARWWTRYQPNGSGNLRGEHPTPTIVPLAADAEVAAAAVRAAGDAAYAQAQTGDDTIGMAVWARAAEKARKLALLYAISADHEHPQITAEAIRWGWSVARHLTQRMLFMAGSHVFDSDFDALCKRMTTILQGWAARHGDAWMEAWKVARRMKLSVRALDEVRDALVAQRRIEFLETATGGRPQRMFRMVVDQSARGTSCREQKVDGDPSGLPTAPGDQPIAVNK